MTAPLSIAAGAPSPRWPLRQRLAACALAAMLVLPLGAGWLLWDNRRLDVTEHEITLDALPAAADGMRIAQVSDVHNASFGRFPERVVAGVEASDPDLIALTGDLIDVRTTNLTAVLEMADRLVRIAPTYFVLGNHEASSALRDELLLGLTERGVVVLRDEAVPVRLGGAELVLVGLDDPWVRHVGDLEPVAPAELLAALELPTGVPTILLAHRPELLSEYTGNGIDLVLSGHAHGGQVRIPGVGGLFAPHQGWFPALTEGVHEREGTTMVISRGLGNSTAAVRVNNPRELVIVELRSDG